MASTLDRSPNASLQRIGTNVGATVARILRTFDRATSSDVEAGATWYADAGSIADTLTDKAGSREHAATVLAHLSPRTTWARNVAGAVSLLTDGTTSGCIASNVDRARASLQTSDPIATLNGPKTRRFALNILGDREAVTVDVWAARVALGTSSDDPERDLGRVGVYDAIEHAYRLAARKRGVDPTTMQATTWIVARNGRAD